jgi:chemotaxis response regulator CheB
LRPRLIGFPRKKVPVGQANGSGAGAPENEAKAERNLAAVEKRTVARKAGLPIVGLGASAGGVEALVEFFNQMRPDAGIALRTRIPPLEYVGWDN